MWGLLINSEANTTASQANAVIGVVNNAIINKNNKEKVLISLQFIGFFDVLKNLGNKTHEK